MDSRGFPSGAAPPAPSKGRTLLSSAVELQAIEQELAGETIIAFDTEFLRERTFFPQLALIQIAGAHRAWLIDPLKLQGQALEILRRLLTNPAVLKVAHAIEQDQECLFRSYGFLAQPVFDTSIGAALCGLGDQVGLGTLLQKLLDVRLPKAHTRTDWMKRPLPQPMLEYAAADVGHLVEAALNLLTLLERKGRKEWALALSAQFATLERHEPRPDVLAERLATGARLRPREYSVLRELVRWREERVRRSDIPRSWLAEDKLLVKLAVAQPETKEDLEHFRGLGAKVVQHGSAEILNAISRGKNDRDPPPVPARDDPTGEEASALAVLKCFLQILAREHQVALRFLVEPDAALGLLRGRYQTLDDLRDSELLFPTAVDLFGAQLLDILNGRTALRLDEGSLVIYRT